jgi:hypothetical protein
MSGWGAAGGDWLSESIWRGKRDDERPRAGQESTGCGESAHGEGTYSETAHDEGTGDEEAGDEIAGQGGQTVLTYRVTLAKD